MAWRLDTILDGMAAGLSAAQTALDAEQAVHGLDALDEVALHPLLAAGLETSGLSVFRETPYPGQPETLPKESERLRCDLVIGPGEASGIADIVRQGKELRRAQGTLFAGVATEMLAPSPGAIEPADAFWLEVKVIGQFSYVDGFAGPNRTYASQFGTCVSDVRKLAGGMEIIHAALAIVLFNEAEPVAEHDLAAFMHKCLDRNRPVAELRRLTIPVTDRIGNSVCSVGLVRVRCDG